MFLSERLKRYMKKPLKEKKIEKYFQSIKFEAEPQLLEFYKECNGIENPENGINILSIEKAIEYTNSIDYHPLSSFFNLFAFEDSENSNPYCIISSGPFKGYVFHLVHDEYLTLHLGL